MEKLPPEQKIYEAYTAIGDGRVALAPGAAWAGQARVFSSTREKRYTVTWAGDSYTADDNATYWQGYAGYPVLAVLLLTGRLPYVPAVAAALSGIPWSALNKKHKRNYAAALEEALAPLADEERDAAHAAAKQAMAALSALPVTVGRGRPGR